MTVVTSGGRKELRLGGTVKSGKKFRRRPAAGRPLYRVNMPDQPLGSWDKYVKTHEEPLGCWDDNANPHEKPLGCWDDKVNAHEEPLGSWNGKANTREERLGSWDKCVKTHEEPLGYWNDSTDTREEPLGPWEVDWAGPYRELAAAMKKCVEVIRYGKSDAEKRKAADSLWAYLEQCAVDENLDDLTIIYRDKKEENAIGYDPPSVARFVNRLVSRYPERKAVKTKRERLFDVRNRRHRTALIKLAVQMVELEIPLPDGVGLSCFGDRWEVRVKDKTICTYFVLDEDEDNYSCTVAQDFKLVNELVKNTPGLLKLVLQKIREDGS